MSMYNVAVDILFLLLMGFLDEFVSLQNDMFKYFREDIHRRLLSPDFKKQVDGLEMLQKVRTKIISLAMKFNGSRF